MFSNNTLCDGAEDNEAGEDTRVSTGAPVEGTVPERSSSHTAGLGQVWILQHGSWLRHFFSYPSQSGREGYMLCEIHIYWFKHIGYHTK